MFSGKGDIQEESVLWERHEDVVEEEYRCMFEVFDGFSFLF